MCNDFCHRPSTGILGKLFIVRYSVFNTVRYLIRQRNNPAPGDRISKYRSTPYSTLTSTPRGLIAEIPRGDHLFRYITLRKWLLHFALCSLHFAQTFSPLSDCRTLKRGNAGKSIRLLGR